MSDLQSALRYFQLNDYSTGMVARALGHSFILSMILLLQLQGSLPSYMIIVSDTLDPLCLRLKSPSQSNHCSSHFFEWGVYFMPSVLTLLVGWHDFEGRIRLGKEIIAIMQSLSFLWSLSADPGHGCLQYSFWFVVTSLHTFWFDTSVGPLYGPFLVHVSLSCCIVCHTVDNETMFQTFSFVYVLIWF